MVIGKRERGREGGRRECHGESRLILDSFVIQLLSSSNGRRREGSYQKEERERGGEISVIDKTNERNESSGLV